MSKNVSPSVIIKSRVRLARNLVDYPFAPVLNDACRKEIIEKVESALDGYKKIDGENNKLLLSMLFEENKVSREFAAEEERHALFFDETEGVYIMVCEEDHLRLQAFADGLALSEAGEKILKISSKLGESLKYAYDNELGFLTHCPTNLGTALRASVMMFLPALTISNRIGQLKSQLEKIGVTIRGIYGEGSSADACIYQISNSLSLGINETDIFKKIETVASRIASDELNARDAVFSVSNDKLTDKIMRSVGTLRYAHMLSSKEFLDCYTYARLGISHNIVTEISIKDLDMLLYNAMPTHIALTCPESANDHQKRDIIRAKTVRKIFKEE